MGGVQVAVYGRYEYSRVVPEIFSVNLKSFRLTHCSIIIYIYTVLVAKFLLTPNPPIVYSVASPSRTASIFYFHDILSATAHNGSGSDVSNSG